MPPHETKQFQQIVPGYDLLGHVSDSYPHILFKARRSSDQKLVMIKSLMDKFPEKEHIASLAREYRILKKLKGEGIIEVLELVRYGQGKSALVMEYFGQSIRNWQEQFENRSVPIIDFLQLSIKMVKALSRVHEHQVIHKDLNPQNILIDSESGEVKLIDFGSSTELSKEHLNPLDMNKRIEGSLPYISPEQTGRMNRDVDFRSDYYSLGVSFYELLSGRLPFNEDNPISWVHAHISKQATPLADLNSHIPKLIEKMVAKLMAKNAEDRYQSANGLLNDLQTCLQALQANKPIPDIEPAGRDTSATFTIPQKLYGREKEVDGLIRCFQRAASGKLEFCLVYGYSGTGKTTLVNELSRSVVSKRGYLMQGKFDQFKQNTAYSALNSAFQQLVQQLLGETKEQLDQWRRQIQEAVGESGAALTQLFPELELIIGVQPELMKLSPTENQNRFTNVFISFVKAISGPEHPLVLVLDDLQWSDVPTLNLIGRIVVAHELSHLLVIGTYRDNEVDISHPLSLTLRDIKNKRTVTDIEVPTLTIDSTRHLVADTLQHSTQDSHLLADAIFNKTAGNPYFTLEMLKELRKKRVIDFDSSLGQWGWNMEAIERISFSDNVVDILVASQNELPEASSKILCIASCIGSQFDLRMLSLIAGKDMALAGTELQYCLDANMIIPLDEGYKYLSASEKEHLAEGDLLLNQLNPKFKFQHDRVQQASYSRIEENKKAEMHLSIGRLLLQHSNEEELEERLIDVVGQLNAGKKLVKAAAERLKLAELNFRAAVRVKQSSSYAESIKYLKTGRELLGDNCWKNQHDLCWKMIMELQHCSYLVGDLDSAEIWADQLLKHSKTKFEKAHILAARTRQYATIGRMQDSLKAGFEGLEELGFSFETRPTKQSIQQECDLIAKNLGNRAIADLIHEPPIEDERVILANKLIMETFAAAYLSASGEMFPYLVLKSVNIALIYGSGPESAFAFAAYAMILCGYFEDPAQGYAYGKLATQMNEKYEDVALKSRILYLYTMFVHHWSNHWSGMTPWFRKVIEAGYQSGDLLYLAYGAQDCIIWDPQMDLQSAAEEHRKLLDIVEECDYKDSLDSGTLFLQMQRNFQGLTESLYSLTDDTFDEKECLSGMHARKFMTGISNFRIYKAEIHLLYNDFEGALEYIVEQEKHKESVMALPQSVRYHLVSFLCRAKMLAFFNQQQKHHHLAEMSGSLTLMKKWADHCPENFEHLLLFMQAIDPTDEPDLQKSLATFEKAIDAAHRNNYRRDEAMINEFAAEFLKSRGLERAAMGYMEASHYLYEQWGALRKVGEMENAQPELRRLSRNFALSTSGTRSISHTSMSQTFSSDQLDINSVLRASQLISGELSLEKLLKDSLKVLIENAGAQKGCMVELREGILELRARYEMNSDETSYDIHSSPELPESLILSAIRARKPVVLANASEDKTYAADHYINKYRPLSVMCVPLPVHAESVIAIYLENNIAHSVFTEERVEVIKLLASQAAISIENARIYEEQRKLLKAQRRFVPTQFLKKLGHEDLSKVSLGDSVGMEMSVLFSDIRDFTRLVENLTPHEVIDLLNRYYSRLGIPITNAGGFIDSYAGDALLALFAIPAQEAVRAGIEMVAELNRYNLDAGLHNQPILQMGIGLNTGPLVLGTMGANERMQCSVLGDTVNLASRIEELTKLYGTHFLISENTYNALEHPDEFMIRKVDRVAVKGKGKAVDLLEIIDVLDDQTRTLRLKSLPYLTEAQSEYYKRNFNGSVELLSQAIKVDPEDKVLQILLDRSRKYALQPPAPEWEGFEKLNHK